MNGSLLNLIDAFPGIRVLVVGEALLDSYLSGPTERLCREAPVPVVTVTGRRHQPGGAANTAVNLRALGSRVDFLSVTGDDAEGRLLRRALEDQGVSTKILLADAERSTLAKQRVLADDQMVVRFDQGSIHPLSARTEGEMIRRLEEVFLEVDAVLVSDYNYGLVTQGIIQSLTMLQKRQPRIMVIDSKRLEAFAGLNMTAAKPNYSEALRLLGLDRAARQKIGGEERVALISQWGGRLLKLIGARIVAVTLDHDGALIFEGDEVPYRTYARRTRNSRAAGAGDTFAAALTLSLASGAHTENAAEIASAAASVVVSREGTSICHAAELRNHFTAGEKFFTTVSQLDPQLAAYRRQNRRIVFTNGCFDILHRGHIAYLNRAKANGDLLIIGLNSDDSVSRLKGPSRPINSLEDRAQVLAALSCIDHIVAFDEDTAHDLIRHIRPDVFVKGGDYSLETLPEAPLVQELGGKVLILPYMFDHSTTNLIERIRCLDSPTAKQTIN
ncbi:MAG: D-glycero-beta-D-manno-heptose 1-phosphate adenylyltransferase [Syntrophotaleaceae bacterium]